MTQDYYGTKRITAWRDDRNGEPGYAVKYSDGYISWSPADVFEAAYQPITAMSFGHAIQAMKEGHKVARAGWNGKGMWIALTDGFTVSARALGVTSDNSAVTHRAEEFTNETDPTIKILPHIDMRAADGSMVVGWLASQTDMLADDWMIVA